MQNTKKIQFLGYLTEMPSKNENATHIGKNALNAYKAASADSFKVGTSEILNFCSRVVRCAENLSMDLSSLTSSK